MQLRRRLLQSDGGPQKQPPFTFGEKFVQLSTPLPSSSYSLLLYFSSLFRLCALLTKSTIYYGYEAVSKAAKRRHATPPLSRLAHRNERRRANGTIANDASTKRGIYGAIQKQHLLTSTNKQHSSAIQQPCFRKLYAFPFLLFLCLFSYPNSNAKKICLIFSNMTVNN